MLRTPATCFQIQGEREQFDGDDTTTGFGRQAGLRAAEPCTADWEYIVPASDNP